LEIAKKGTGVKAFMCFALSNQNCGSTLDGMIWKSKWFPLFFIFLASLLLFSTDISEFRARVTDLSAIRVLAGEVPYRDFWTIYAPGSFYVTAGAFALFGRQLIVSNLLGILTASLAVTVYFTMVARIIPFRFAFAAAIVFAAVFWNTGYSSGFESYPPAILFLLLGAGKISDFAGNGQTRTLLMAGVFLGLCILFKHDVGGYACLAGAATLAFAPVPSSHQPVRQRLVSIAILTAAVLVTILPPAVILLSLAGKDMVQDLILFPLRDFRWARPESFPSIIPRLSFESSMHRYQYLTNWTLCNFPLFFGLASLLFFRRKRESLQNSQIALIVFSIAAFPFFWFAAHIQINTHPITLAALALLAGSVLFSTAPAVRRLCIVFLAAWFVIALGAPAYKLHLRLRTGTNAIGLPHLFGIRESPAKVKRLRQLADAIRDAAPPDRSLLMISNRNDIVIYAEGFPYWLSDRKMITRHHELHPGVTDTAAVQRRMLQDLSSVPLPVIVWEYRFSDPVLERVKRKMSVHLPNGATLLDDWVKAHYLPGPRFLMYQVLYPKS
jgi:hypothetical protein